MVSSSHFPNVRVGRFRIEICDAFTDFCVEGWQVGFQLSSEGNRTYI